MTASGGFPYSPCMATVFLDGSFVDTANARVSAFDAGFQHGVGLFETMLAVRPSSGEAAVVLHMDEHLQRLSRSAASLGLSKSMRIGALGEAVRRTVEKAASESQDTARFRVRVTVTGGDLNLLNSARQTQSGSGAGTPEHAPTLLIHVQPAVMYPPEMFTQGVLVTIADWKTNPLDPFQGHKTLNYWPRLRELQVAAGKRASEALIFQVTNHLSGGCVSNALIVKDGVVYTPIARGEEEDVLAESEVDRTSTSTRGRPDDDDGANDSSIAPTNNYDAAPKGVAIPSPVLPGIVRKWALDTAESQGIRCERRMLTIHDVLGADELILTNSSWGILPVVAVEANSIGDGHVGKVTGHLVDAWQNLTEGERL
jgi:branched-chain amino acid aminotransferase